MVDSLKVLDPNWPIREADVPRTASIGRHFATDNHKAANGAFLSRPCASFVAVEPDEIGCRLCQGGMLVALLFLDQFQGELKRGPFLFDGVVSSRSAVMLIGTNSPAIVAPLPSGDGSIWSLYFSSTLGTSASISRWASQAPHEYCLGQC